MDVPIAMQRERERERERESSGRHWMIMCGSMKHINLVASLEQ